MKNNILVLFLAVLVMMSCTKEAETENKLIGTWHAVVMTAVDDIDGTPLDLIAMGESMTLRFEECGVDGQCQAIVELSLDGDIEIFDPIYVVDASGNSMAIPITFPEEITIVELTADKLIISTPSFVYGNDLYVELDKE
jgi:hypothetical protein